MPLSQPAKSQKHADYFEGIIQIRPYNEEVYRFVMNQFKKNETAWPSKQSKLKTGVDIYSSSWRFTLAVGKKMKKSFGGKLTTSRKLYSQDHMTSKKVYRVTVCHRLEKD